MIPNRRSARRVAPGAATEIQRLADLGLIPSETIKLLAGLRGVKCGAALKEWRTWRATFAAPNTVETQAGILTQLLRSAGSSRLGVQHLLYEHLDDFVNRRDMASLSTRRARVAALKSFFRFLQAKAYYVGDPSSLLRIRVNTLTHAQKEGRRRRPFTDAEFRRLMEGAEGFWRQAAALSYWAGLRLSDIACLEQESILDDAIVVWTRKSARRVELPLSDPLIGAGELRPILATIRRNCDRLYAFPKYRGIALDPRKRAMLSVQFGRTLRSLNLADLSFHCLRHSFCSRLAAAGKTVEEIGRLVGHASADTTRRYVHR